MIVSTAMAVLPFPIADNQLTLTLTVGSWINDFKTIING